MENIVNVRGGNYSSMRNALAKVNSKTHWPQSPHQRVQKLISSDPGGENMWRCLVRIEFYNLRALQEMWTRAALIGSISPHFIFSETGTYPFHKMSLLWCHIPASSFTTSRQPFSGHPSLSIKTVSCAWGSTKYTSSVASSSSRF